MPIRGITFAAIVLVTCMTTAAPAQHVAPQPAAVERAPDVSPQRVAAAVRGYHPDILRALLALADKPDVLEQLAQQPELTAHPERIDPPVADDLRNHIRALQSAPEIALLAAAMPEQLATLQALDRESPGGLPALTIGLDLKYTRANKQAVAGWQQLLEASPAAADAYRELLTRFTRAQIEQYAAFPHVEVLDAKYYQAAPPIELIMAYAESQELPAALADVLERWWGAYAPEQIDAHVLQRAPLAAAPADASLAAAPVGERRDMWRTAGAGGTDAVGLMPVIMQPQGDQPADALLAYAVNEHARLWAPPAAEGAPPLAAEELEEAPYFEETPYAETPHAEMPHAERPYAEAAPPVAGEAIAPPPVDVNNDGFVPWTDVVEAPPADIRYGDVAPHERDVAEMYGELYANDEPVAVYEDAPPVVVYEDTPDYYVHNSYDTYYGGSYPYYTGYVWTWPLVVCDRPALRSYGGYYGVRVHYQGSRSYFGFYGRGGGHYYYNSPVYAPYQYKHRRHYWRNYGYPYGDHGGYVRNPYGHGKVYVPYDGARVGRYYGQGQSVIRQSRQPASVMSRGRGGSAVPSYTRRNASGVYRRDGATSATPLRSNTSARRPAQRTRISENPLQRSSRGAALRGSTEGNPLRRSAIGGNAVRRSTPGGVLQRSTTGSSLRPSVRTRSSATPAQPNRSAVRPSSRLNRSSAAPSRTSRTGINRSGSINRGASGLRGSGDVRSVRPRTQSGAGSSGIQPRGGIRTRESAVDPSSSQSRRTIRPRAIRPGGSSGLRGGATPQRSGILRPSTSRAGTSGIRSSAGSGIRSSGSALSRSRSGSSGIRSSGSSLNRSRGASSGIRPSSRSSGVRPSSRSGIRSSSRSSGVRSSSRSGIRSSSGVRRAQPSGTRPSSASRARGSSVKSVRRR